MDIITPCRKTISERFPILSFVVRAPGARHYEIACATDPRLFHTDYIKSRTANNFFTSRSIGLLAVNPDNTVWVMPPEQLKRFAGSERIYYALGTYSGRKGEKSRFTISPYQLNQVPSIMLAPDYTGRKLDRGRTCHRPNNNTYGSRDQAVLRWGGDIALEAERQRTRTVESIEQTNHIPYDDGFDPSLWGSQENDSAVDKDYINDGFDYSPGTFSMGNNGYARNHNAYINRKHDAFGSPADEALLVQELAAQTGEDAVQVRAFLSQFKGRAINAQARNLVRAMMGERKPTPAMGYGGLEPAASNSGNNRRSTDFAPGACYGRPGKHPDYRESLVEESMPIGPASRPLVTEQTRVLDIPEKVRILRVVSKNESGDDEYSSVSVDTGLSTPDHETLQRQNLGLSWGIVHFTQRSGMLGQVLKQAKKRELALLPPISAEESLPPEHRFEAIFGDHWQQLLNTTDPEFTTNPEDRLAPVGESPLWEEPWLTRFRNAGSIPYVQAAQNEVAITEYFNKIERVANWLGIHTARGLAMLLDRVIHAGLGAGLSWIMANVDAISDENDRRIALQAVTGNPDDLSILQQQQGIEANGEWNAMTHAALIGALRDLGDQSPIAIPGQDNMLRNLMMAAEGTEFEHRVQAVYNDSENFDDNITYELV